MKNQGFGVRLFLFYHTENKVHVKFSESSKGGLGCIFVKVPARRLF